MSDASHAVFLSYASQDAAAANRIAAALRGADIEVWLDQSELTGGDAWDRKIRDQIGTCVLFAPLISANTQARREGYFRIEWKLAAQRTHAMADGTPFLLPIVIDGTKDKESLVPEEFRAVQWTRLPGGETSDAFSTRVKKLLGSTLPDVGPLADRAPGQRPDLQQKQSPRRPWLAPALIGLAALAAVALWQPWKSPAPSSESAARRSAPPTSEKPAVDFTSGKAIAVLAFADLSADKGSEYFADGVSEELLDLLSKVPGLRVVGRTSSFSFKGKNTPAAEIAQKLGVAYLVDGSVARDGTKVRIAARLINASDGFQLWSDKFTRELTDIFKLQDEIAGLIAKSLSLKLGGGAPAKPVDPEVFRLYLAGKQAASTRTEAGYAKAQVAYERAVALDPKFARAHAALAEVWYLRRLALSDESEPGKIAEERVHAGVERALALDPNLAEAYTMRATLSRWTRDDVATEADFRRAFSLNPNDATAHHRYGAFLARRGNLPAGLAEMEIAMRLDPLAPIIPALYGLTLSWARRWEESLAAYERALAIQPDFERAHVERVLPLIFLNRRDEALALARVWAERKATLGDGSQITAIIGLGLGGDRAAAEKLAAPFLAQSAGTRSASIVILHLALGHLDEGLDYFARARFSQRISGTSFVHPACDAVRDDPRFLRRLEELGLLAEYREAWSHVPAAEKNRGSREASKSLPPIHTSRLSGRAPRCRPAPAAAAT